MLVDQTAQPVRRTQAMRRATTRQGLLEAARSVLAADGYHALTLATVAARAGVTTGAVQRHFISKAGLLLEVSNWIADEHLRGVTTLIDTESAPDLSSRLRNGLLAVWQGMDLETVRAVDALNDAAAVDPELRTALLQHGAEVNAVIRTRVAHVLGGEVSDSPRLQTALTLITLVLRELALTGAARDPADATAFLVATADLISASLTSGT